MVSSHRAVGKPTRPSAGPAALPSFRYEDGSFLSGADEPREGRPVVEARVFFSAARDDRPIPFRHQVSVGPEDAAPEDQRPWIERRELTTLRIHVDVDPGVRSDVPR